MSLAGEPSMEEILASIKKVIARDTAAELAAAADRAPASASRPAFALNDDDILDLGMDAELVATADSPLVTEDAIDSMRDSLAALSVMAQPGANPQIVRSGETSLEGLVRDMLRPALAEWLDKNLPPLVERMVSTEIARIVGKKA
jgi:cell pole-organizing protein PopZ